MGASQLMDSKNRGTVVNVGEAYSEPEIWSGKTEGSMGNFRTFKLDPAGRKSLTARHCPHSPELSTNNFTSRDTQWAFVSSPLNTRWNQWPSLHHSLESFLGNREAILRKGRYILCWHWEFHWMTATSSTAIALFKMQNADVFRGCLSINHCMQILPVKKSFPCKSLLLP